MKMKLKKIYLILLSIMLIFSGCAKNKGLDEDLSFSEDNTFTVLQKKEEELYLYNPYIYELILYNQSDNSIRTCFGENELLEYCFELSAEYPYVSVGVDSNFYVFDFQVQEMKKIYMEENGYIVPFATDGTNFYYILKQADENHAIVLLDENGIEIVVDLIGKSVEGGVVNNGCLYYSNYIQQTDSYEIYEYDLLMKTERLIKKNVEGGDLFVLNGEILYSSQNVLYNDSIEIDYMGVCVKIIDEYDILVEWDVTKECNYLLRFIDINKKKEIASVLGGINYVLQNNCIQIYTYDGLVEVPLLEV